jgi:hypothetical protein
MKVTIESTATAKQINEVRDYLNHLELFDPNFNGCKFELERGDYTEVDGSDDLKAQEVMYGVCAILNGD